jgi:uncharacterized membrane-anchored protein
MPAITETQIRVVLAAIAAVCAFLLVQPDVVLPPWAKVIVGAVIVALAVINPQTVAARTTS